jgi:hypothetical protein
MNKTDNDAPEFVEAEGRLSKDELDTVTAGYGGGGSTGKVQFQDFHFTKRCD